MMKLTPNAGKTRGAGGCAPIGLTTRASREAGSRSARRPRPATANKSWDWEKCPRRRSRLSWHVRIGKEICHRPAQAQGIYNPMSVALFPRTQAAPAFPRTWVDKYCTFCSASLASPHTNDNAASDAYSILAKSPESSKPSKKTTTSVNIHIRTSAFGYTRSQSMVRRECNRNRPDPPADARGSKNEPHPRETGECTPVQDRVARRGAEYTVAERGPRRQQAGGRAA